MKKVILILSTLFVFGCGTTFQERKVVYVAIYKKAAKLIRVVGPTAANVYLDKKIENGEITIEEKEQILAIAESTVKKLKENE